MIKRLIFPLASLLAIASIGVGCGGGSDGDGEEAASSSQTASISRAEFIEKADAVCGKGQKQVKAEYAAYLEENDIEELGEGGESETEAEARMADIIEAAIPALRQQLEGIRELGAPAGEEARVSAYLEAAEAGIEKGEEDPRAMFTSSKALFAQSDKLAGEIGFKVCGQR